MKKKKIFFQLIPRLTDSTMTEIEQILLNKPIRPPMISTLELRWRAGSLLNTPREGSLAGSPKSEIMECRAHHRPIVPAPQEVAVQTARSPTTIEQVDPEGGGAAVATSPADKPEPKESFCGIQWSRLPRRRRFWRYLRRFCWCFTCLRRGDGNRDDDDDERERYWFYPEPRLYSLHFTYRRENGSMDFLPSLGRNKFHCLMAIF